MSDTKWTKGEWRAESSSVITSLQNEIVVCCVLGRVKRRDDAEDYATAHLIAAAPDLYEALRYAATHIEMELGNDHDAAVNARKQLAKARGENT